jgi:RecB family exonuclease
MIYLHQSNAPHCALTLPEGQIRVLDGVNDDELGETQFMMLEIHKLQHEQNSTIQHHYRAVNAGKHTTFCFCKVGKNFDHEPSLFDSAHFQPLFLSVFL